MVRWFEEAIIEASRIAAILVAIAFGLASIGSMLMAWLFTILALPLIATVFSVCWILDGLIAVYIVYLITEKK